DVSHMGVIEVGGQDSIPFLGKMLPFRPETLPVDRARYSFLLNARGGIVDDLMVFRLTDERFLLVVNAATAASDLGWLRTNASGFDAILIDDSPDTAILALQGIASWEIVREVLGIEPADFKYHGFVSSEFAGTGFILSKTGYTGEKGFEVYIHKNKIGLMWDALMDAGQAYGLIPCGLGARDTLRLEMGYLLYGQDADDKTTPVEAGYESAIDEGNTGFIGREALIEARGKPPEKKLVGLELIEHGVPRHGNIVYSGDAEAGVVTSGNFSPSLRKGIALGYIKATAPADNLSIDIRGKRHGASVAGLPFYKKK
ncbi:MAG: glycine cleavage system aminomethyltransferase GcvT, partial [Nitrospirota bacterium]